MALNEFTFQCKRSGMDKQQVKSLLGISSYELRQYRNGEQVPPEIMAKLEEKADELAGKRNIDNLQSVLGKAFALIEKLDEDWQSVGGYPDTSEEIALIENSIDALHDLHEKNRHLV